jgi:hypothetical protein
MRTARLTKTFIALLAVGVISAGCGQSPAPSKPKPAAATGAEAVPQADDHRTKIASDHAPKYHTSKARARSADRTSRTTRFRAASGRAAAKSHPLFESVLRHVERSSSKKPHKRGLAEKVLAQSRLDTPPTQLKPTGADLAGRLLGQLQNK